jgi:hypothetical protein
MTNNICKIIYVGLCVLLMGGFALACGDPLGETSYSHREASNGNIPIAGARCNLTLMSGQVYSNNTNSSGWVSFCYNSSSSINQSTCIKPRNYTAVLNAGKCQKFVYLGNLQSFTFNLTNTLGEPLEAQDCYMRVYYNDTANPYLVEDLKTNLLYDNQTFIDHNGNYVRTAGVPISSSNGVYAISWPIRAKDERGYTLYRPYQSYEVRADCNGKILNCDFNVGNQEPIHLDESAAYYEQNAQVMVFGVVVILITWFFIIPALKKGGIFSGGGD